jgi:uncharacterized protein (DUF305 family)
LLTAIFAFLAACGQSNNADDPNHDHASHDHSQMTSDADADKAPYDLQFLDTMIIHHDGAVVMARLIANRTSNTEMKEFGKRIVNDQEKEIAQMKKWREEWFAGKPRALNMSLAGMADSMKMDMKKLMGAREKAFDLAFVEMMIPHHQGAVSMSNEALQRSERAEIKTLAEQIIKAQEAEIKMMEGWLNTWKAGN